MTWLIAAAVRPLILAAAGLLILEIFRVRHPASQHSVWTAVLSGMLLLVPLSVLSPSTPPPPAHVAESGDLNPCVLPAGQILPKPPAPPTRPVLLYLYLVGVLLSAVRVGAGWIQLHRVLRGSSPAFPRVRESADVVVPVTGGLLRPSVVMPQGWRDWPAATRDIALAHEFEHLRRRDPLTSLLASLVRCLFWFHPLAWWLSRKVAELAEIACDAAVIESTACPADYSRVLLQFAADVSRTGYRASLPGPAMTEASGLDSRIDRLFAAPASSLRKLSRPAVVLGAGLLPALCLASALDFTPAATRSWRSAPFRVLLYLQNQHVGKLDPGTVPGQSGQTELLRPATSDERAALPIELQADDKVFAGTTFLIKGTNLKLALVEPAEGDRYLFADVNLNGTFEASERFSFTPVPGALLPDPQVILRVQMARGPFPVYPVRMLVPEERIYRMDPDKKGGRTLLRTPFQYVQGVVEIGGKPVRAEFMFDPDKQNAYPDYGWIGMDTNGDGVINEGDNEEHTLAKDETVIFHVNGHDVSTASIDTKAGTFVVREHPPGANTRLPLHVGDTVPEFGFSDVDGKARQFSEFRGKYVLLDFWGTWCGPCRAEMPNLEKAWQTYRSRGLVVLGIDDDEDIEKPRKFLTEKGITFPQAAGHSGLELAEKRFRINSFPTTALIDPTGKVITLGDSALRGGGLAVTLDKLLPK
jgi:beta-lactamase regulating signal transducer with metallopeptidase domain/peroxiredoxin